MPDQSNSDENETSRLIREIGTHIRWRVRDPKSQLEDDILTEEYLNELLKSGYAIRIDDSLIEVEDRTIRISPNPAAIQSARVEEVELISELIRKGPDPAAIKVSLHDYLYGRLAQLQRKEADNE